MEDIINEFDLIIQEMANAVANANSQEEADKIQEEYDTKITEAEKVFETKLKEYDKEQELILQKEQEASEKEIEELESVKEEIENGEEGEDENTEEFEIDKNKYKELYPNKTAIKKLNEVEAVALGKKLNLPVDINLKATENDKIVIDYFEQNIW